jgi:hypothetical protein
LDGFSSSLIENKTLPDRPHYFLNRRGTSLMPRIYNTIHPPIEGVMYHLDQPRCSKGYGYDREGKDLGYFGGIQP